MAMTNPIQPILHTVRIDRLHPTQMTVGMREVARKQKQWQARRSAKGGEYLGNHMIPAVRGPGDVYWIIDHHHLVRALHEEQVDNILVAVLGRLDHLSDQRFLAYMDRRNWLHPYDAKGERCAWSQIPKHVKNLADDPYRSLAGEVRRAGGFAKMPTPYTEFHWADFFRDHFDHADLTKAERFAKSVERAVELARTRPASYLPGYAGAAGKDKKEDKD